MSTLTAPRPVIQVSGIRKTYGATVAVDEVSFEVNDGEIFGLIGPNGAGKTTTMEGIEGLRTPDRGTISVLGLDLFRQLYKLQERIGVQLQQAQLQKRIKVWEAVYLWASLYGKKPIDGEHLLEQLGLTDKRDAWFMTLSGGQKQRLFIALALINDPEVVFLDELNTGLDPQSRRAIWDLVRGIRERGKTVFLTTHLMEEPSGYATGWPSSSTDGSSTSIGRRGWSSDTAESERLCLQRTPRGRKIAFGGSPE
jgi:ABC-2 type transport system ATP-binding protein